MSFQITLRCARINCGLNRKEGAKLLNIHDQTLGNYEHDSTRIPISIMNKLESVYGIPLEMFFFGNEKEFYKEQREKLGIKIS